MLCCCPLQDDRDFRDKITPISVVMEFSLDLQRAADPTGLQPIIDPAAPSNLTKQVSVCLSVRLSACLCVNAVRQIKNVILLITGFIINKSNSAKNPQIKNWDTTKLYCIRNQFNTVSRVVFKWSNFMVKQILPKN